LVAEKQVIMALKRKTNPLIALRELLIDMGDTLQEVSLDNLERRGGWDSDLFASVLTRVERQTPDFQTALVDYLTQDQERPVEMVTALLAVDRLATAYTYWTRLFPPRQPDESMFVLSLLHDLSDKVEYTIQLIDQAS
jgi:hypothetical protein